MVFKFNRQQFSLIFAALIALLLLVGAVFAKVQRPLTVSFLDVGQGDAILIQTPQFKNILVDTGPGPQVVERLGEELGFFEKKIDLFILTHPDWDHYGGVLDVIGQYNIKSVALTGVGSSSPVYREFLERLEQSGTDVWHAEQGRDLQIAPDLWLDILYPFSERPLAGQEVDNKNDTSISLRLVRRLSDGWEPLVTLTGDGEEEQEWELVLSGQDLSAPLFKLGHHGSKTSSTQPILNAIGPEVVVASCGKDNPFGHPHPEVIQRVADLTLRRTDLEGTVRFSF